MTLATDSGGEVVIDRLLKRGRRGDLFRLSFPDGTVLKRYRPHDLEHDPALERRLRAMISRPPGPAWEDDRHVRVTWPSEVVLESGRFIGFLMPIVDGEDILEFSRVADPSRRPPAITWRHLVGAAANLAYVTGLLHGASVVIGDFTEYNLRVANDAHVAFLGCDAMQFTDLASVAIQPE